MQGDMSILYANQFILCTYFHILIFGAYRGSRLNPLGILQDNYISQLPTCGCFLLFYAIIL